MTNEELKKFVMLVRMIKNGYLDKHNIDESILVFLNNICCKTNALK